MASFVVIFLLMLLPLIMQGITGMNQAVEYRAILNNMDKANQLNRLVKTKIEPVVWDIVAGKVRFEKSDLGVLMTDIRFRMNEIRRSRYTQNNRVIMDVVLRTMSTLEDYVKKLEGQIVQKRPVSENEAVLEEIRGVVTLIADLMQDFIGKQLNEAAVLNEQISSRSTRHFILNIFLVFLVVVLSFFAMWAISGSITQPIEKLRSMAAKVAKGDFHSRVSLSNVDELDELAESLNAMAEQIEILLAKSIEEERSLKISEMQTLQTQITPHFLYNTLDAIIWAAESNKSKDVIKLVTSLSSFFRITLSHGGDFIPLRDEIRHVENYLIIQQMRYHDILEYEITVDGKDILDTEVLKLLLQPLVENAIYHGIKNTRGRGKVHIDVKKNAGGIRFCISDTGLGITPEKLELLRRQIRHGGVGYGLFNVNRRLELCYGLQSALSIASEYTKGTQVFFVLPDTGSRFL